MSVNTEFNATDKSFVIKGTTGKHGELAKATLFIRDRAIVSVSGDMHKLHDYDGLVVCNVADELTQILGLYYHGDIYPLSRKTLCDNLLRLIHLGMGKGRGSRKNLYKLRRYESNDGMVRITDGVVDLIRLHMGNILLHPDLEQTLLGKDKRYIKIQCRVIHEVLGRPTGASVVYSKKSRLVSKHENFKPLVAA
jgi:hypothetical protein